MSFCFKNGLVGLCGYDDSEESDRYETLKDDFINDKILGECSCEVSLGDIILNSFPTFELLLNEDTISHSDYSVTSCSSTMGLKFFNKNSQNSFSPHCGVLSCSFNPSLYLIVTLFLNFKDRFSMNLLPIFDFSYSFFRAY